MEEKVIFAPKTVKIKGGEILIRLLREEDGRSLLLRSKRRAGARRRRNLRRVCAILQRARASRCVRNSMASRWGM